VKNKTIYFSILITLTILGGCVRGARVPESSVDDKPVKPLEEVVIVPEEKIDINYDNFELEILDIQQIEEKPEPYNSYNPKFSHNEQYIAFEIHHEMYNKIYIYQMKVSETDSVLTFEKIHEVYMEDSIGEDLTDDLFESSFQESFNYEFNWFPRGSSFIFTSNAGMGEYNLFMGSVIPEDPDLINVQVRLDPKRFGNYLMMTEDFKKDGQARVSPDGNKIVFTSGRTGNGDLYLMELVTGNLRRLTDSEFTDFFPQWSPDSSDIVFTTGGKQSHDIHIIRDVGGANEREEVLVKWFFDDVLPKFSPDGKNISFYTTYNEERDPFNTKRWGIMIIPSDGSAPAAGKELIKYFHVADAVKDNVQGIAWFPDSKNLIFAKNIDSDFNPIYIYSIETGIETFVETDTNINHDIYVSPHGIVTFRAQVLGWDRIFIASTSYFEEYLKERNEN
jgi:Tol biopolymer transport system component